MSHSCQQGLCRAAKGTDISLGMIHQHGFGYHWEASGSCYCPFQPPNGIQLNCNLSKISNSLGGEGIIFCPDAAQLWSPRFLKAMISLTAPAHQQCAWLSDEDADFMPAPGISLAFVMHWHCFSWGKTSQSCISFCACHPDI